MRGTISKAVVVLAPVKLFASAQDSGRPVPPSAAIRAI